MFYFPQQKWWFFHSISEWSIFFLLQLVLCSGWVIEEKCGYFPLFSSPNLYSFFFFIHTRSHFSFWSQKAKNWTKLCRLLLINLPKSSTSPLFFCIFYLCFFLSLATNYFFICSIYSPPFVCYKSLAKMCDKNKKRQKSY